MSRVAINYKLGSSISTVTSAGLDGRGLFSRLDRLRSTASLISNERPRDPFSPWIWPVSEVKND